MSTVSVFFSFFLHHTNYKWQCQKVCKKRGQRYWKIRLTGCEWVMHFLNEHMWSHPPVTREGSAALRSREILLSVWFVTICWPLHITTSPHHCAANHAVNCENPTDLTSCDTHEYYQVNCSVLTEQHATHGLLQ